MDTYRIFYTIDGITYSFICQFTLPKNDPRNNIVFLSAIENDKERISIDGIIENWKYELLHP